MVNGTSPTPTGGRYGSDGKWVQRVKVWCPPINLVSMFLSSATFTQMYSVQHSSSRATWFLGAAKFHEKIIISPLEEERLGIPDGPVGYSVLRHLNLWRCSYGSSTIDKLVPTIHDESPRRVPHTQPIYNSKLSAVYITYTCSLSFFSAKTDFFLLNNHLRLSC